MFAVRQLARAVASPRVAWAQTARAFAAEAPADKIRLSFTSPVQAFYAEQPVNQVNVPSTTGNFGILPNHVPSLAVLKPGVVSVFTADGTEHKYFVSSGTITVNADSSVQVIAEEAAPLDQLDITLARKGLDTYNARMNSGSEADKAEAEIAVEVYTAMVRALEG